jgi:cytosine/adenosine deaminase-related metal-dependent hydrolase
MTDMARNPLDRSAAFTSLLELDPEGFGKSSDPETMKTITTFLDDFYESGATNMYAYCREWLDARDDEVLETVRQAEEVQAAEAVPPAAEAGVPEDPDKPWQVTAQVCRSVDGWQSSRQVPAFTIPRALAYSREDAEAKARVIINPYGEPYDIHMDVTTDYVTPERQPEAERQVLEGDEQQLGAAQEGQAEADAEAWGPGGPSASYPEWVAEGQEDPGPGERQLEDWNEHNYQVDGLEPERGE